ncbi:MAG: hypothetical protein HZB41_09080 [Ignavibacteriae bacterium]|nr:hypothetical protein [Ignavibacteriota bacterium]
MKSNLYLIVIFSVCLLSLTNHQLYAETPQQPEKYVVGLAFYHQSLVVGELSTFSGSYDLFVSVPVSDNTKIYAIMPFTNYSRRDKAQESYSGIGNLILGVKYLFGETKNNSIKCGIALPTIGNDSESKKANLYSAKSRIYDLDKFVPELTTLSAEFHCKYPLYENYFAGGGTGMKLYLWTGAGSQDAELFLPFNVFIGYEKLELIRATATFKGIYFLTNEHGDFADNFMNILQLKVSYPGTTIEPGLFLESPMNDSYEKWLDYNIGLFILVKL